MRRALLLLLLLLGAGLSGGPARAQGLIADVSDHLIAITTGFSGTDVLVFGALEEAGEVVIVVRGPARPVKLYRKSQVLGVWLNAAALTFPQAPSFYAVAATQPLEAVLDPSERRRLQLGLADLDLRPQSPVSGNLLAEWRDALIEARVAEGLYSDHGGTVTLLGERLFRASIALPTNVPIGTYLVEAYVVENGIVVAGQTIPLVVSKVGLEADIYNLAQRQGALYGLAAILTALLAGWVAHLLFRRH